MRLTVVGCGDAFGSGGRLQTCYHVAAGGAEILLDCGATTLIGLQRQGIDPNRIGAVAVSHLHGDHFGGLPWLVLHARHVARRQTPLVIAGPEGTEDRFRRASEVLFADSMRTDPQFGLEFRSYDLGKTLDVPGFRVTAYPVSHPSGAVSCGLRLEAGGRTLAFTGDTEWTDSLLDIARDADLLIAECYAWRTPTRYHMGWSIIEPRLGDLGARRVMLTHMNSEMLANAASIRDPRVVVAADGLVIDV